MNLKYQLKHSLYQHTGPCQYYIYKYYYWLKLNIIADPGGDHLEHFTYFECIISINSLCWIWFLSRMFRDGVLQEQSMNNVSFCVCARFISRSKLCTNQNLAAFEKVTTAEDPQAFMFSWSDTLSVCSLLISGPKLDFGLRIKLFFLLWVLLEFWPLWLLLI